MLKAIIHSSELLTGEGVRRKDGRHPQENDLGRIKDGAVIFKTKQVKTPQGVKEIPGKIFWVGATSELPKRYLKIKRRSLRGEKAVCPGLVDCHTHLIFAGDRSTEFARRCGGESYETIAADGGGILTTVNGTREATVDDLEKLAIPRVKEAYGFGVRTLEIKSGYGLTPQAEIKLLETIKKLKNRFPEMTFYSTFLGAHAFPPEVNRESYINQVITEMLPVVAKRKLAKACDVFVDQGYYTNDEGRKILMAAKKLGLAAKIHADELANTESTSLAVELRSLSADHLLKISESSIVKISKSHTVAVLLPGTAFYLKAEYAPARRLIDAGACVAISTDFNPGSSMCNSLPAIMTLSALYMSMSKAEIFAGVTYNAAKALGLHKTKGSIERGRDADLTILPFKRFEESYYRFAWAPV